MNIRRSLLSGKPSEPLKTDGHLSDDWLLLSIDGELSVSDHARVKEHVRACWTCRARREQLEKTIKEIVEYEHALVAPDMPPSPGGRSVFMARLDQLSDELSAPPLMQRWSARMLHAGRLMLTSHVTKWAVPVAFTIACVLYLSLGRHTPVVSANELLQRATASERRVLTNVVQPVEVQRIGIKAGGHRITRTLYSDTFHKRQAYRADIRSSEEQVLKSDFGRTSFSWDNPLSPQIFSEWRDGIAEKKDVITELDGGLLRLDTSADFGPVAEASLTVRADDYHPVAENLWLRDNTHIEIAELSYDIVGLSTLAPEIFGSIVSPDPLKLPSIPPASSVHVISSDAAQIAESELQALTALHHIGADLGEQIHVHQSADGVIAVDGIVEDEARKQRIISALAGIEHTQLRVTTVAQVASHSRQGRAPTASSSAMIVAADAPLLEEQLVKRFPNSDQRTNYVHQLLSLCQSASARAWALNRLANRYTPQQIALLNPESQRQLQSLLTDHTAALREDIGQLQNQLGQVLPSASDAAALNGPTDAPSLMLAYENTWRKQVYRVHSSVEILNESVTALLASSAEDKQDNPETIETNLRTTINQLHKDLQSLDQKITNQL